MEGSQKEADSQALEQEWEKLSKELTEAFRSQEIEMACTDDPALVALKTARFGALNAALEARMAKLAGVTA